MNSNSSTRSSEAHGPQVDLIGYTPYPLEQLYCFWHQSRTDFPPLTAAEVHGALLSSERLGLTTAERFYVGAKNDVPFHEYFDKEVRAIISLDFPLKETIQFNFVFSNVTITWREQAVRDRDATPWSQTSRTRPLENFADNRWYEEPAPIRQHAQLHNQFHNIVLSIQDFYRKALAAGIQREDARCLQPTCQTQQIAFGYDGRTLEHSMEKRLCFIAQSSLWQPVVAQIRDHLIRIDPRLDVLFHPPCVKGGKFRYCVYEHENERRLDGRDPYGPCPLYTMHTQPEGPWTSMPNYQNAQDQYVSVAESWPMDLVTAVNAYILDPRPNQ